MSRAERRARERAEAKRKEELARRGRTQLPRRARRAIALATVAVVVLTAGALIWTWYAAAHRVVVTVDGKEFTERDLTRRVSLFKFLYGTDYVGPETRKALQDSLVDEYLVVREAARRGLAVTEEEIAEALEEEETRLVEFYGSEFRLTVARLSRGVRLSDVIAYERGRLLRLKLYDEVTRDVTFTEDEVLELYQQYKETLDQQGLSLADVRER
ncbi:MAG: SurA N-terminal domain-containing protein, partial [Firmicutes bacterium]|nr:SurA N-terminal domain-containing protein [Bacillota bacterium]